MSGTTEAGSAGIREVVEREIRRTGGVLRLRPALVARTFLPSGRRLSLLEEEYAVGPRGEICERWFASETEAENAVPHPHEGLSFLDIEGEDILLRDANRACGPSIMGPAYASSHRDLGRLAKLFDFSTRLFLHVHLREREAALIGKRAKEEAYYFPAGVDPGPHPETFFGVHPSVVRGGRQKELLLPHLRRWDDDLVLGHSRAYQCVPGDGFHLPAGILHAPGSVLTLELQEPSDVAAVWQARVDGRSIPRAMLNRDIAPAQWEARGEEAAFDQVDWEACADPYFYEHHHTPPLPVRGTGQPGGFQEWIFYNSARFSGKRLVVRPGARYVARERGVVTVFAWSGRGRVGSQDVEGKVPGRDELLVVHETAAGGVACECTGPEPLELFLFFGPGINDAVAPAIPPFTDR